MLTLSITGLTLFYIAPHIWWMFGISYGFPGDQAELEASFQRLWFVLYNTATTTLVAFGAIVTVALEHGWISKRHRRLAWLTIVVGAVLLSVRAVLGTLTTILTVLGLPQEDFTSEITSEILPLVWEAWFNLTGALFVLVAVRHRGEASSRFRTCDGG